MIGTKHILNKNNSLKQAVDWCSLVGIDEVICEIPNNYFAIPAKKEAKAEVYAADPPPKETNLSFDSYKTLDELEKNILESRQYQALAKTASHTLFGQGAENAKVMVISEQPGREEDISNIVFSGKNGQIIRSLMGYSGLKEDEIYYTYLSKWRPPGGRKLNDFEQKNLSILLKRQINIIMPQIIVTLGETALHTLIPKTGFNFRKNVGKLQKIETEAFGTKIAFLPLFHEESLLKTPQLKKATWLSVVNCKGDLIR